MGRGDRPGLLWVACSLLKMACTLFFFFFFPFLFLLSFFFQLSLSFFLPFFLPRSAPPFVMLSSTAIYFPPTADGGAHGSRWLGEREAMLLGRLSQCRRKLRWLLPEGPKCNGSKTFRVET
ncbi:hypothetical protein E1A91_D02G063600v1 [Gossypium mustelinum]|uniref:Uncharacterized protein n=3 Tax=Gossypium TaxID=3633 RepID=A0A5J5S8W9_GOSBA|nr:hypothetical protein ES319_D02G059100v1 [Gossypium barbadense]TYH82541.1 hypothetical protein ES332_D02G068200v1 [Gossypium tomentosum]TYI92351.1 hypothetical protein E1A91_D02G063600v1 [Gossypium mustelinum]